MQWPVITLAWLVNFPLIKLTVAGFRISPEYISHELFFPSCFWPPVGTWRSLARDRIQAAAVAVPDPYSTVPSQGSNLCSVLPRRRQSRCTTVATPLVAFLSFFFSLEGRTPGMWKFPGCGSSWSCSCRPRATPDPSCVCDLHHGSRQCRILDPQSKARD